MLIPPDVTQTGQEQPATNPSISPNDTQLSNNLPNDNGQEAIWQYFQQAIQASLAGKSDLAKAIALGDTNAASTLASNVMPGDVAKAAKEVGNTPLARILNKNIPLTILQPYTEGGTDVANTG